MKNILILLVAIFANTINAQVDPSDGCSGIPTLTMGQTCSTNDYTLWGSYENNSLIQGDCINGLDLEDGWFQFVATSSSVKITTYGDREYSVSIFENCGGGAVIACEYSPTGNLDIYAASLDIGLTYYVQIHKQESVNVDMVGDICIMEDCTNDVDPPTGTAPADENVMCSSNISIADPLLITDEADNCGAVTVTHISDVSDNNTCPETITRTYRLTDDSGNNIDVLQTITVNDIIFPTGTAPANVNVETIGDVPNPDPFMITDEADNCSASPIVGFVSDVSDGGSCPEIITRTYSITDDCGNVTNVQQTITVNDVTNPTGSAPANISVEGSANIPSPDPMLITDESDNSGGIPIVQFVSDVSDGNTCPEVITRTYSISDDCGNQINLTQTITVNDTQSPVMGTAPANVTVECSADIPAMQNLSWTDNADGSGMVAGNDVSDGNSCAETITRTWTYTDGCGNMGIANQTITVNDVTNPTVTAPANVTVDCNANIPAVDITAITDETDNCTVSPLVGHVSDVSDNNTSPEVITRTYSITDDCGNVINVQQIITVSNPSCEPTLCDQSTPSFSIDMTGDNDSIWVSPSISRDGYCCEASGTDVCIEFEVILDENAIGVVLSIASGAVPPGALFYENSCSDSTAMNDTLYLDGVGPHNIIFCKPGNNQNNYQIESIPAPPPIVCNTNVDANVSHPTCRNDADGAINLTVSGGQTPYTYSWNTGENSEDLMNLQEGNYAVIVSDANGCDVTLSYTLSPQSIVEFNIMTNDASCGNEDGSALASVTSGLSPYSYNYTSGDTTSSAGELAAGMYNVTVTDVNGCTASETFIISTNDGPLIFDNVTQATCPDDEDGAIDLSVSGGQAPYSISWGDGETSEDRNGLSVGIYDVEVTDDNGCTAMSFIEVTGGDPILLGSFTSTSPSCGNNDGQIAVTAQGGNGNLTYQWDANTGNQSNATATGLGAGGYYLTVTDDNGCIATQGYMLSNSSAPSISVLSNESVNCDGSGGNVNVELTGGTAPYSYSWSNGETTQDLVDQPVGVYDLEVSDANNCSGMISIEILGARPSIQEICMVTVDSSTNTNLVVWEKPATPDGIEYYNIYREGNAAGVFELMDTVDYSSLSQWTDPNANPMIRGWRYKVSAVDSCGNESQLSLYHKTIHLTINQGIQNNINLIWDDYIGHNLPSWIIERFHSSTGWEIIDTIPSNLQSYTDANVPADGDVNYSVYGVPAGGCTSTKAQDHNSTRSNRSTIASPNFENIIEMNVGELSVYPNPSKGLVQLEAKGIKLPFDVGIYDLEGRLLLQKVVSSENEYIDISSFESGVYLLKVSSYQELNEIKLIKY